MRSFGFRALWKTSSQEDAEKIFLVMLGAAKQHVTLEDQLQDSSVALLPQNDNFPHFPLFKRNHGRIGNLGRRHSDAVGF